MKRKLIKTPKKAPATCTKKVRRNPNRFAVFLSAIRTASEVAGLKCAPETL